MPFKCFQNAYACTVRDLMSCVFYRFIYGKQSGINLNNVGHNWWDHKLCKHMHFENLWRTFWGTVKATTQFFQAVNLLPGVLQRPPSRGAPCEYITVEVVETKAVACSLYCNFSVLIHYMLVMFFLYWCFILSPQTNPNSTNHGTTIPVQTLKWR